MSRLKAAVELPLPGRTVPQVVAVLQAVPHSRLAEGRIVVRCTGDGLVQAHVQGGGHDTPPTFRGALHAATGEVTLRGTVSESHAARFTGLLFTEMAVFTAVMTVVTLASATWPGPAVCGPAAVAFSAISWVGGRARRPAFDVDARRLRADLAQLLTADGGDGEPTPQ